MGLLHYAEEAEGVGERGVVTVALENGVVELVDLVGHGGEDEGGVFEGTEAGEEGDELGLDEVFDEKPLLDEEGEEPSELDDVGAELKEERS